MKTNTISHQTFSNTALRYKNHDQSQQYPVCDLGKETEKPKKPIISIIFHSKKQTISHPNGGKEKTKE